MAAIRNFMTRKTVSVSFEFFPPADEAMEKTLWESIRYLEPLNPKFVSVTYGADGSTRERTHNVVSRVQKETGLNCVPHLTCIGASQGEVLDIARKYWDQGIRHIVALRGDPPAGVTKYEPRADNLKRKIDAGASRAITQFFYDTELFLRFRDACAAKGIDAPIVPGILPITRFPQITRFAKRCGASIPDWLEHRFDGLEENPETRKLISAAVAIEQVHMLQRHGVDQFHFYTLNRSELTYAICHALGARPKQLDRKVG
jgi:methylenetetrahydrofolate reductase (NADPH)